MERNWNHSGCVTHIEMHILRWRWCLSFSLDDQHDDGIINSFKHAINKISTSQRSGRLWTLEEAM